MFDISDASHLVVCVESEGRRSWNAEREPVSGKARAGAAQRRPGGASGETGWWRWALENLSSFTVGEYLGSSHEV